MFVRKVALFSVYLSVAFSSVLSDAMTSTGDILKGLSKEGSSELKNCADKGSRICARNLGLFYYFSPQFSDGKSSQDIDQAKAWLNKTTFYPISRYALGKIYINENGKEKLSESLLLSSCTEDNKDACLALYKIYMGKPVGGVICDDKACNNAIYVIKKAMEIDSNDSALTKDDKKFSARDFNDKLARLLIKRKDPDAIPLLEKEVEADAPFASSLLAPLYETGELAAKNLTRAYMMYDLSGSGYADEKAKVAEQMTPEQVREAQEMSWRWQDEHRSYRAGYRGGDIGIHGKFEQR